MSKVRLIKISDNRFNGSHPNDINVGYVTVGDEIAEPEVGSRYMIYQSKFLAGVFSTSKVIKIINKETFETENSTYKLEYL